MGAIIASAPTIGGQSAAPIQELVPADVKSPTTSQIESLLKEVEASRDLDDDTKKKAAELLESASQELKRADDLTAQSKVFESDTKTVAGAPGGRKASAGPTRVEAFAFGSTDARRMGKDAC